MTSIQKYKSKARRSTVFVALLVTPFVTYAKASSFTELVNLFIGLVSRVIALIVVLALAVFFWGIVQFLLASEDSSRRSEGIKYMTYGVIALFVMVSAWGLVAILQNTVFGPGGVPQF